MRLKLTLQTYGQDDADVVATVDSTTTIGALASYLAGADPRPPLAPGPGDFDLTLTVHDRFRHELDAGSTVPESGLHSGVTVSITRRSESALDAGRPVAVAGNEGF